LRSRTVPLRRKGLFKKAASKAAGPLARGAYSCT